MSINVWHSMSRMMCVCVHDCAIPVCFMATRRLPVSMSPTLNVSSSPSLSFFPLLFPVRFCHVSYGIYSHYYYYYYWSQCVNWNHGTNTLTWMPLPNRSGPLDPPSLNLIFQHCCCHCRVYVCVCVCVCVCVHIHVQQQHHT